MPDSLWKRSRPKSKVSLIMMSSISWTFAPSWSAFVISLPSQSGICGIRARGQILQDWPAAGRPSRSTSCHPQLPTSASGIVFQSLVRHVSRLLRQWPTTPRTTLISSGTWGTCGMNSAQTSGSKSWRKSLRRQTRSFRMRPGFRTSTHLRPRTLWLSVARPWWLSIQTAWLQALTDPLFRLSGQTQPAWIFRQMLLLAQKTSTLQGFCLIHQASFGTTCHQPWLFRWHHLCQGSRHLESSS